ncbi:MAG: alpha-ketoglutarate-dependent dioxygenase AlkB [Gemmataceae bacterium]
MITPNDVGVRLHDKATRGLPLSTEEQALLTAWYARLDEEERKMFSNSPVSSRADALREQVNATLTRIVEVAKHIQMVNRENDLLHNHLGVPGLTYCREFLALEDQHRILAEVDVRNWFTDLKRRVQHYGYRYDYRARKVDPSMYVGPLPPFALEVAQKLRARALIDEMPDQLIVNEYEPGQGITAHIDCEPCFKNTIVTVSLGSACVMDLIRVATKEVMPVLLDAGSALVLRDEARYEWMHRIQARKSDDGIRRRRRVSLTFRNVILRTE